MPSGVYIKFSLTGLKISHQNQPDNSVSKHDFLCYGSVFLTDDLIESIKTTSTGCYILMNC